LGDIGRHFPDTDPALAGADSRVLLRHAYGLVKQANWTLVNLDATIHAQAPKIAPHVAGMIENLAQDLVVPPEVINIKGKTNESLGFLGRKEGIAVTTVVLLQRI
jgi:2-C-methyl-D-erythritol 2,4-cyclodiphosphate synthase